MDIFNLYREQKINGITNLSYIEWLEEKFSQAVSTLDPEAADLILSK